MAEFSPEVVELTAAIAQLEDAHTRIERADARVLAAGQALVKLHTRGTVTDLTAIEVDQQTARRLSKELRIFEVVK